MARHWTDAGDAMVRRAGSGERKKDAHFVFQSLQLVEKTPALKEKYSRGCENVRWIELTQRRRGGF